MDTDSTGMGGDKDPIPAPTDENGNTVNYTVTVNLHDHTGQLLRSQTQQILGEMGSLPHGEYTRDVYQADPNASTIGIGDPELAGKPRALPRDIVINSFTPYGESSNGVGQQIWDAYKIADPIHAGEINGAWNFASSTVEGLLNLAAHPEKAVIGLGKFAYYTDISSPGRFSAEGIQYNAQLIGGILGTIDKFKNGDAYTKSSMSTEAALTIGSLFVGGGAKTASNAGLLSNSRLSEAISTLREGSEITVGSIKQARQILKEMPELRPHVDKYPSNSGELFSGTEFGNLYKQPRGTYRGDLFPLNENLFNKGLIHDSKNLTHDLNPHFNIRFFNGKKAAIIIN